MIDSKLLGKSGEEFAANWLQKAGYSILTQNFRYKTGEIDIIAKQDGLLIFVEVKSRSTAYFQLSQLITKNKQQKIISTAQYYIAQKQLAYNTIYRFDIALIEGQHPNYSITYIENAFTQETY